MQTSPCTGGQSQTSYEVYKPLWEFLTRALKILDRQPSKFICILMYPYLEVGKHVDEWDDWGHSVAYSRAYDYKL